MNETEQEQVHHIDISDANEHLPAIVARHLQRVASENTLQVFDLATRDKPFLSRKGVFHLPANVHTWIRYREDCWILVSNGTLFVEPTESIASVGQLDAKVYKDGLWVITLYAEGKHLQVIQYLPAPPTDDVSKPSEAEQGNTGFFTSEAEQSIPLSCARCGEIASTSWLLNNKNQQEAEQKIRFLLGYGCNECQFQDWADPIGYADRFLLRLIELFLFTHLDSNQDRVSLLLSIADGMHMLQREILGLPVSWREPHGE